MEKRTLFQSTCSDTRLVFKDGKLFIGIGTEEMPATFSEARIMLKMAKGDAERDEAETRYNLIRTKTP